LLQRPSWYYLENSLGRRGRGLREKKTFVSFSKRGEGELLRRRSPQSKKGRRTLSAGLEDEAFRFYWRLLSDPREG